MGGVIPARVRVAGRILARVVCSAVLGTLGWVVPVQAEESGIAEIPPLSQEQVDLLFDSLRANTWLRLPPGKVSQQVDPNLAGLWAGSKVNVSTDIDPIVLRFRRKVEALVGAAQQGSNLTEETLESFDITITARAGRTEELGVLRIRHSHPGSPKEAEGVAVSARPNEPQTLVPFMYGRLETSIYAAILPFERINEQWGVFICPRRLERTRDGAFALTPSVYELYEVKLTGRASADATMSTGGQPGRVAINFSRSKELPPSSLTEDHSVSALPRAFITYKPTEPFDFFRFKPLRSIQQGLIVSVTMQSKIGYVRKKSFARAVYVHLVEEPMGVPVFVEKRRAVTDNGECYIVFEQDYSWMEYDKQTPNF